jgi:hypothetical protein
MYESKGPNGAFLLKMVSLSTTAFPPRVRSKMRTATTRRQTLALPFARVPGGRETSVGWVQRSGDSTTVKMVTPYTAVWQI